VQFPEADVKVIVGLAVEASLAVREFPHPASMQFCGELFGGLYWLRIHGKGLR
jgi:hypothetical protein